MTNTPQVGAEPTTAPDGTVLDHSPAPTQESTVEWVDLHHPDTGGHHRSTREAFESVWQHKGWVIDTENVDAPKSVGGATKAADVPPPPMQSAPKE